MHFSKYPFVFLRNSIQTHRLLEGIYEYADEMGSVAVRHMSSCTDSDVQKLIGGRICKHTDRLKIAKVYVRKVG
jgi:hypothetical protein